MGANAQTSVPLFSSGEVLTAANQNISAGTGVPVFATTTTRDAAFGGTGEKVLAEGQLCYIEASDVVQYYNGTAWATLGPASSGALTLISSTTIGSGVSTVTVSSAFSSTYDNYRVVINGGVASGTTSLTMQLGSTTSNYYYAGSYVQFTGTTVTGANAANTSSFAIGDATTSVLDAEVDLRNPNLAKVTTYGARFIRTTTTGITFTYGGYLNDTTQYTAFTIGTSGGTLTGGTIRVYGYANS
jgi:hypothetical protein